MYLPLLGQFIHFATNATNLFKTGSNKLQTGRNSYERVTAIQTKENSLCLRYSPNSYCGATNATNSGYSLVATAVVHLDNLRELSPLCREFGDSKFAILGSWDSCRNKAKTTRIGQA